MTEPVAGTEADIVLNATTGRIGLADNHGGADGRPDAAVADQESLVSGGTLVTRAARPGQIVPVDSEHSAVAQCIAANEQAVLAFTSSSLPFPGIMKVLAAILDEAGAMREEPGSTQQVLDTEPWARARADEIIANGAGAAR